MDSMVCVAAVVEQQGSSSITSEQCQSNSAAIAGGTQASAWTVCKEQQTGLNAMLHAACCQTIPFADVPVTAGEANITGHQIT
jgi:hypothetical protein